MITLKEDIIKENFKKLSHNGELDGKLFVKDREKGLGYIYKYEQFKRDLLERTKISQLELAELYEEWIEEYQENYENIGEFEDMIEEVIYNYIYDDIFKDEKIIYEYYPVKESLFEEYENCYLVVRYLTAENRNALEKVIFSDIEVTKDNINGLLDLNDYNFEYGVDKANHSLLDVSKLSEADLIPFLNYAKTGLEAEVGEGPTHIYLDETN